MTYRYIPSTLTIGAGKGKDSDDLMLTYFRNKFNATYMFKDGGDLHS